MASKLRQLMQEYYGGPGKWNPTEEDEAFLDTCETRVTHAQYHRLPCADDEMIMYASCVITYCNEQIEKTGGQHDTPAQIRHWQDKALLWMAPYLIQCQRWMPNQDHETRAQKALDYPEICSWVARELVALSRRQQVSKVCTQVNRGGLVAIAGGILGSVLGIPGSEAVLKLGVLASAGATSTKLYVQHKEVVDQALRNLRDRAVGPDSHIQSVLRKMRRTNMEMQT